MFKTGMKPGKGWYICTKCGEDLYLDEDTDKLPPCAKCYGVEFNIKPILLPKRIPMICEGCGHVWHITINTENINPKKLKCKSCEYCPKAVKKKEFKAIAEHGMKPKEIKVGKIYLIAEIKPIKSKRYG